MHFRTAVVQYRSNEIQEKLVEDERGPYVETNEQHLLSAVTGDEDSLQEWEDAGLDSAENTADEDLYLGNSDAIKSSRLVVRSQVRHIVMANQHLRNQWGQATIFELTGLMRACGEQIRSDTTSELRKKVISLVMIMLWTGSQFKVAKKLIWKNKKGGRDPILLYDESRENGRGAWIVRPHLPVYKKTDSVIEKSYSRKKDKYLILPDPFGIGAYLKKAFPDKTSEENSKVLFHGLKNKGLRQELRSFLDELPDGHRLNENKISRYLFHKITMDVSGDIADAILITGQYHPLGKTLLHYTTPDANYLRNVYVEAIKSTIDGIYAEGYPVSPPNIKPVISLHKKAVGSRLCPRRGAVRSMTCRLKSDLRIRPINNSFESVIKYHNIFTIYTSQMLGYATGYRAVKDPFLWGADIDGKTGLAVISDKDGEDYYNSRLIWVPPGVRKQLSYYEEHREHILSLVASMHPELVCAEKVESLPGMFFLTEEFTPEQIRPKSAKPHLENYLPLPLNVNRRFLRTELKTAGCPPEIINAFMGHWSRGEEPWGKYSSLSPKDYVEKLQPYITGIQKMIGFVPVRSLMG